MMLPPGSDFLEKPGACSLDDRPIDHWMVVIGHAGVTVRMKSDHIHAFATGVEAVDGVRPDQEGGSCRQRNFPILLRDKTLSESPVDDPSSHRRVSVGRLDDFWGKVEMVEAGITFSYRRNQQAVGAPVDVSKSALGFHRATEDIHSLIVLGGAHNAEPSSTNRCLS